MAATKTQPGTTPAARRHPTPERPPKATANSTADVSGEVLAEVEAGQRAAIQAVRTFLDTVDRVLPPRGEGPSRRQEIVDAAMEMADRLVHTQYDFLRKVVHSAGKSLGRADGDGVAPGERGGARND
jgi:hypothetical protein